MDIGEDKSINFTNLFPLSGWLSLQRPSVLEGFLGNIAFGIDV